MTPIDPTDERALYDTWVEAFERTNAEFFDGTRGKDEPRGDTAGMLAVARAVLPEGYVAVPIELVRDALRFADH